MARKRKPGKREPNGRLSRKAEDVIERDAETAAQIKSVVIKARVKMWGLTEDAAEKSLAGYALGRLLLTKEIHPNQMAAAEYYLKDREAAQRAILAPREANEPRIPGSGDEVKYEKFVKDANDRWAAAQAAIDECCREERNNLPRQAIDLIIIRDIQTPSHVGALRSALNALVRHYLIGKRRAA